MEARLTNKRQNKALHPTAYSFGFPLVPRSKPALPAAGELGRCVAAPAWMREAGSTLAADIWSLPAIFGGVGSFGGRGLFALARRFGLSAAETNQQQHNQALHPTARSVVVFAAARLASKLVVTGGRRVRLAFGG